MRIELLYEEVYSESDHHPRRRLPVDMTDVHMYKSSSFASLVVPKRTKRRSLRYCVHNRGHFELPLFVVRDRRGNKDKYTSTGT